VRARVGTSLPLFSGRPVYCDAGQVRWGGRGWKKRTSWFLDSAIYSQIIGEVAWGVIWDGWDGRHRGELL